MQPRSQEPSPPSSALRSGDGRRTGRRLLQRGAALLLGTCAALALGELVARALTRAEDFAPDPRNQHGRIYQHDAELGWSHAPGLDAIFEDSRPTHVRTNSLGLRDEELDPGDPRPRLLFLGDSFVWGYDVEAEERFTDLLREAIPDWRIVNAGISGYGTDQELLLLRRLAPLVEPSYVFLMWCRNDSMDNAAGVRHRGFAKPYFELVGENEELVLRGVPVPRSIRFAGQSGILRHSRLYLLLAYRRLEDEVGSFGDGRLTQRLLEQLCAEVTSGRWSSGAAGFSMGMTGRRPEILEWAARAGVVCLDLENDLRYPRGGRHWTPEGHAWVAERILTHLREVLPAFAGMGEAREAGGERAGAHAVDAASPPR